MSVFRFVLLTISLRKDTVMVYWGQQSYRNEEKLSEYCKGDRYDVLVVSWVSLSLLLPTGDCP